MNETYSKMKLTIPLPRTLTEKEELALYRAALERNPHSHDIRFRLASQLLKANCFDELLTVCRVPGAEGIQWLHLQIEALLSRESPEDDRAAKALSVKALTLAVAPGDRARFLTMLAKTHIRLSELEEARACLREALTLDAREKDAYKRTVALALKESRPDDILKYASSMLAGGVAHSRVLCSQSIAFARLGMMAEAREAQGFGSYFAEFEPTPPEGWESLAEFNRQLAEEVNHHPDTRYERYGTASARTWRIDEPSIKRSPLLPVLQQMISREIQEYVARLPLDGSAFVGARPAEARLRNWCVITEGDGHETWHVHQNGWLSGVYYIHVQDHIAQGTGKEGCIAFGLPTDLVGEENAREFGEVIRRPRTGLMMIFPSHIYHRTYAHHGSGRRICYAFDVIPSPAEA